MDTDTNSAANPDGNSSLDSDDSLSGRKTDVSVQVSDVDRPAMRPGQTIAPNRVAAVPPMAEPKPVQSGSAVAPAASTNEPAQDLNFVGYEPPKEKPYKVFIKKHAVQLAIGVMSVAAIGIAGGILVASSGKKEAVVVEQPTQQISDTEATVAEAKPVEDEGPVIPDIAAYLRIGSSDETTYQLVSDGVVWLERPADVWEREIVAANGWVFFAHAGGYAAGEDLTGTEYTQTIAAFNPEQKKYVTVAEVSLPIQESYSSSIFHGGDIYMRTSTDKGGGKTYRCTLDAEKACTGFGLFYDGFVSKIVDEQSVLVSSMFSDASIGSSTMSLYNTTTQQATEIVTATTDNDIGTRIVRTTEDSLIWVLETTGTVIPRIAQLYAVDVTGATKFVIPAEAIPLASAAYVPTFAVADNEVLFATSTKEVIFNTTTKQFGAVGPRQLADVESAGQTIEEAASALQLPDGYTLESSNE